MNYKACRATRLFLLNSGLAISSWAPMVPYVKMNLDLSEGELGLTLLLFGIGALLVMPLSGYLVHHYGSRKVIPIGSWLLIMILPILATVSNVLGLSIVLFMFGAVLGVLNVSVNNHAIIVEQRMQQPMMSRFHCLFSLGGLLGATIMSCLLELGASLLLCTVLFSLFMALTTFFESKHLVDNIHPVVDKKSERFSFPQPLVLFFGLLCFISFLAEGAILDWGAILLRSTYNYNISVAGIGYAFFAVAMALGRWTGDYLKNFFSNSTIVTAGGATASIGLFTVISVNWAHLELLGFFLIGLGASNIVPILFSSAGQIKGTPSSLALTTMTTLGYMGILIGPAFIGFVAELTSLSIALGGIAFLMAFVSFCGQFIELPAPASATS